MWTFIVEFLSLLWKTLWAFLKGIGLGLWNNPILIILIIVAIAGGFIIRAIIKRRR